MTERDLKDVDRDALTKALVLATEKLTQIANSVEGSGSNAINKIASTAINAIKQITNISTIVYIDSIDGVARVEPDAYQDGAVAIVPHGRGEFIATLKLPPGATIDEFNVTCERLSKTNCCNTPRDAYDYYRKVLEALSR